jgi:hypothetical protein
MLKKLLVALIASAFTMGAYAQAQKAEPKGQTGTTTQPATPPSAKGDSSSAKADSKMEPRKDGKAKKAKSAKTAKASKTSKAKNDDAKDSRKDATTAPKKDVK